VAQPCQVEPSDTCSDRVGRSRGGRAGAGPISAVEEGVGAARGAGCDGAGGRGAAAGPGGGGGGGGGGLDGTAHDFPKRTHLSPEFYYIRTARNNLHACLHARIR
jgi:hypothetical protein